MAWANIVRGVPINGDQDFTGDLFTLLNPYGLLGGVTTVLLFLAHGAIYLNLRTGGDLPERARAVARWASPAAAVAGIAFLAWTAIDIAGGDAVVIVLAVIGALLLVALRDVGARAPARPGRSGSARSRSSRCSRRCSSSCSRTSCRRARTARST